MMSFGVYLVTWLECLTSVLIITLPKQDLEGSVGPDAWEASPGSSALHAGRRAMLELAAPAWPLCRCAQPGHLRGV